MEARAVDAFPALATMTHPQAQQGTLGHAVVAQTLSMIYQHPAGRQDYDVVLPKMEALLAGLDDWSKDGVRRCVTYVVALVDSLEKEGLRVTLECEMHLSGQGIAIQRGGTADVVILARDASNVLVQIVLVDHKLGFLDQGHASEHLQLAAYAVMAWDRFAADKPLGIVVDVHLAQGRLRNFTAGRFDANAIAHMRQRIQQVVCASSVTTAELNPDIEACRYCKALTMCRAAREKIMNAYEETALFGMEAADLVKLAHDAAIAKRFAEEVSALQKQLVKENQEVTA